MSMESKDKYSPEEIAEIAKKRTLSDAELLNDGAEYQTNEKGHPHLVLEKKQIQKIHEKFERQDADEQRIQGYREKEAFFYTTIAEIIGPDIVSLFERTRIVYTGDGADDRLVYRRLNIENDLWRLREKYDKEIEGRNCYSAEVKSNLFKHSGGESIFNCMGCMVGYLRAIGRADIYIDETRK